MNPISWSVDVPAMVAICPVLAAALSVPTPVMRWVREERSSLYSSVLLRLMSMGVRFWEHGNLAVGPARQIARERSVSTGTDLCANLVQRHLVEEWTLRLIRLRPVWKPGAAPSCWRMNIASQQARICVETWCSAILLKNEHCVSTG